MMNQEQQQDGRFISQRIQQFKVIFDAWHEDGFGDVMNDIRLFRLREMAKEILDLIREHCRKYNIHSGITAQLLENMQ